MSRIVSVAYRSGLSIRGSICDLAEPVLAYGQYLWLAEPVWAPRIVSVAQHNEFEHLR